MDIVAALWIVGMVAFVFVMWRLALWADDRGWIMVRKRHGRRGLGVGMMSIGQIYSPSIEHVVEEVWSEQTRAEQDEKGEGEPGKSKQPEGAAKPRSDGEPEVRESGNGIG